MSGHKFTICLLLVLGVLLSATQLTLAQISAIQPVRIEATTAQEESISYIYEESHALVIGVSSYTNGWSKLAGVKEDVIEVQKALEENGFEVQLRKIQTSNNWKPLLRTSFEKERIQKIDC